MTKDKKYKSVRQMVEVDKMSGEGKKVYPVTPIQAVYDARTGASLEAILAQFNNVFLQYQGSAAATRCLLPMELRRVGITISYRTLADALVTERCMNDVQRDNEYWCLDVNWARVDGQVVLSGELSVSEHGTWVVNGEDTGIVAQGAKGDNGLTPWLKFENNKLYGSYDKVKWDELSGLLATELRIKGYVSSYSALPSSAIQGEIWGVGPTNAGTNPTYRYYVRNAGGWVDNGEFTSIAAGIVQETGDGENVVMSQKAVSDKIAELESEVGKVDVFFREASYLNIPKIASGQKVKVSLNNISDSFPVIVYGKNIASDSEYQRFGVLKNVGESIDCVVDFDINYIRVVSDPIGNNSIFPLTITILYENSIANKVVNIENEIVELGKLNTNIEEITYTIKGADVLFQSTTYTEIPAIKEGDKFHLSLKAISGETPIILYGKNSESDSTYQTLGVLSKAGDVLNVVADFDINYVRVVSNPTGTTSMFPLTITIAKENNINARLEKLEKGESVVNARLEKLEKGESVVNAVPCMFNPTMDFNKQDLKVFDIGNSYTLDAQHYLDAIIKSAGLESNYSLYRAHRSGASFKSWADCFNNQDSRDYNISKCSGKDIDGISGDGVAQNGELFRNALESVKWDVILIHQASAYANNYDLWQGTGDGGYLREFIQIIRKTNPQATIGFLLVHSYRSNYSGNSEGSSLERWKNIAQSAKNLKANYGIDFIIPYGTAVQNLRASSLNDEYEFSNDGTHLATGLGDYVAGCCYFQSLFAPRFGVSIFGNNYIITGLDESLEGQKNVTSETALVAQKAAMLAAYNMWEVMNPDDYEL